jgi:dimethylargininase
MNRSVRVAITRDLSPRFAECELTHLAREPIDLPRAVAEHAAYRAALVALGVQVLELPASESHPDCVFVEDTAVVFEECAVITRPGAASRRGETPAVAAALSPYRRLLHIEAPGTLDGGDVLVLDRQVLVGATERSNAEGIAQLARLLSPYGYRVQPVPVRGCLHLKSAVTALGPGRLLINPAWVERAHFPGCEVIEVDPAEPAAANVLAVGERVICARHYPRTLARLRAAGIEVLPVDAGEVSKAEGAVTCCSVVFDVAS